MKNILLLFFCLFYLQIVAQNQKPTIEIYGNINSTLPFVNHKYTETNAVVFSSTGSVSSIPTPIYETEIDPKSGFSLGAMLNFKLKKRKNIDFLAGIEYTFLRFKKIHTEIDRLDVGFDSQSLISDVGKRTIFGQIALPIEFRFKHKSGFYANLGISVDILLFVREKYIGLARRSPQDIILSTGEVDPNVVIDPVNIDPEILNLWGASTWEEIEVLDKSRENFNDANISTRISIGYQISNCFSLELRHRRKLGSVYKDLKLGENNKVLLNLHSVAFGMNLRFGKKRIE